MCKDKVYIVTGTYHGDLLHEVLKDNNIGVIKESLEESYQEAKKKSLTEYVKASTKFLPESKSKYHK